jgi:hypothetical protein
VILALSGGFAALGAESAEVLVRQSAEWHARLCPPDDSNSALGPSGPTPAVAPHLTYYGGRVISNIKLVMVLYGSGTYGSYIANDAAPSMASFYQQVVASSYIDWLCEYATPTQAIGRGAYAGKVTITPSAANNGHIISDANIQSELARQLAAGHLPAPDANTLYMLHFPQGKIITSQGLSSCVNFCGYHGTMLSGSTEVYYAVLPDMSPGSLCNGRCGGAASPFANQCSVASHEIIEAITDPEVGLATVLGPPLGWYDAANGEIGDICNANETTFLGADGNTYTVQAGFSDAANACIASRTIVAPVANSQNVTHLQDTPVIITLTGVDSNVCPQSLTYTVISNPPHGQLTGILPILTYTPVLGYFGPDSFQFKVNNGALDSAPSTVSIFDVPTHVTIARLADQNARITFAAITGWLYEVKATDYLTNPIPWVSILATNVGTNALLTFDDLTATNHPHRFYHPVTP